MKKIYVYILSIFIVMATFSCSEWLDVKPQTESEIDAMFSNQIGFKDALTGCYIRLKSQELYGKRLSWGDVEYFAQIWEPEEEKTSEQLSIFNWKDSDVEDITKSIFSNMYKVIGETNLILEHIDNRKSVFKDEKLFALIKGEAIGIRAYCHFDLLRLFGPMPTETTDDNILPYVKVLQKEKHKHIPYIEYVSLLKQDINDALALLKTSDPQVVKNTSSDNYFKNRNVRINYYALIALKARVHLWLGEEEECLVCCNQILDSKKYKLGDAESFNNFDYSFSGEHLSAVYEYDLSVIATENFTKKGNLERNREHIELLYPERSTDIRYISLWKDFEGSAGSPKCTLIKYHQSEESNKVVNQIPLIRLSEIYFMAMECGKFEIFKEYANSRDITAEEFETKEAMRARLIDEYAREFCGEGQLFYQYKRWNLKNIRWYTRDMTKENYVMPIPVEEF